MEILYSIFEFCIAYAIMLIISWIIASQSLYLYDAKAGKRNDIVQRFRDELQKPIQYIVNHYLSDRHKKSKHTIFRVIFAQIFRAIMALVCLFFILGFAMQSAIYLEMQKPLNSASMALVSILSFWHLIAAWRFGQRMMQFQKRKTAD